MKVLWNDQPCEVLEETENLYALEVEDWQAGGEFENHMYLQVVWVKKEWVELVRDDVEGEK